MDQAPKNERYTEYPSENDLRLSFENFLSVLPLPIFESATSASPKFLPPNFPADLQNP